MSKYKLKTNRGAAKRFHITANGKIKMKKAYASHILTKKTTKRKRNLRKAGYLSASDLANARRLLPYG
ncbi:50S ribosomal protein L35 [bacterium]|nr:50S ribosomal protein L35 [bacterium]